MTNAAFALPDFTTVNVKTGEIIASNGTFSDTSHKRTLSKLITDINALGLQVRDVFTTEHNFSRRYHRSGFGFYSNAVTVFNTSLEICNTDGELIGEIRHREHHENKVVITVHASEHLFKIPGMRNVAWIVI